MIILRPLTPLWMSAVCLSILLASCGVPSSETPFPEALTSESLSPIPSATPSPQPATRPPTALSPLDIWVVAEGLNSDAVLGVSPDGNALTLVRLPLNEGQHASDVVAARNGCCLAYLVWDESGQHGVAVWNLSGPNARLAAQPLPGYRIMALFLSDDGSALAYVQVEKGASLDQADWRLDSVPLEGGQPTLLVNRESTGDVYPLMPFAWPAGGPLLLNAAAPDHTSQGIFAVNPVSGEGRLLIQTGDEMVVMPALSPIGSLLAYLTHQTEQDEAASQRTITNAVRVRDLRLDTTVTVAAPPGQAIYGMRWHPDGRHLLLDLVTLPTEDAGLPPQFWALAPLDQPPPWPQTESGPERQDLFDYEVLGNGVVYTTLPASGQWQLYVLPEIGGAQPPVIIPLELIAQESAAPAIIRVPYLPNP
jgi:hypothetical protein